MVRPRFDPSREFVAMRGFPYQGKPHEKGDPFDKTGIADRNLKTLYDSRYIDFAAPGSAPIEPVDLVTIEKGTSRWLVKAAWLDEPIRETTKTKAEARAEQLRAEGPPLGWIAGGTVVTLESLDGGWYAVSAPWLDEPEKVQGREAAEARQSELHAAGEPATHHGFTLTEGENGWWMITPEANPETALNVHGEGAAREGIARLRSGETVEGAPWNPVDPVSVTAGPNDGEFVISIEGSDETETVIGEELAQARADEIRAGLKTIEPVSETDAMVLVQVGDNDWTVTAPWLEQPETFDTAEAAEARQAELRAAGIPEGWTPPAPTE